MNEPAWIINQAVLAMHDVLLVEFGGAPGLRDASLLESALARPLNLWSYEKPNVFRLASAYTYGIVKNHPFVDGNKRTGYLIGGMFLERNGHKLRASEEEATAAIMGLASHQITETEYAHWLQANCE
jgi:death-on-curing protein